MEFSLEEDVLNILDQLRAAGYDAYVAGGAVRDLLMGNAPHDYDIATNARPEEVKRIFKKTIDTGLKHGTVTVIYNKVGYEITTFRRDGEYGDGRHPDSVRYVNDAREDCRRRDFTINAMMYNPRDGIIDCFGGREDIKRKTVRCVGKPERRFKEDALRMLRAVRFAAALSFKIDTETEKAIKKCAPLIRRVSGERILGELNKIILSDNPDYFRVLHRLGLLRFIIPQLERCFGEPQRNKYHVYDVGEHIMHTVKNTPRDFILRWAALMHDIGKPCCASMDPAGVIHFYGHHRESRRIAVDVLHRLHMDGESIKSIAVLVENHDIRVEPVPAAVKRTMARCGAPLFEKLLILQRADNMAKNQKYFSEKSARIDAVTEIYNKVLAEDQPYLVSQLVINGSDLIKAGFRTGRIIGDTLKALTDEVIINPKLNNREYLLGRAVELKKKKF